jgi:hypothetical protein
MIERKDRTNDAVAGLQVVAAVARDGIAHQT